MIWILDPGHGGIINNKYVTAPAKMHRFEQEGVEVYEGVINRGIKNKVVRMLIENDIKHWDYITGQNDIPLRVRTRKINDYAAMNLNCVVLSIHSNAARVPGSGNGFEIFTSKGETKSDKIAQVFADTYQKNFPQFPFRKDTTDGDDDKEANFWILQKTTCPALLVENLFFDEWQQATYLMTFDGQMEIAKTIVESIKRVENEYK